MPLAHTLFITILSMQKLRWAKVRRFQVKPAESSGSQKSNDEFSIGAYPGAYPVCARGNGMGQWAFGQIKRKLIHPKMGWRIHSAHTPGAYPIYNNCQCRDYVGPK